MSTALIVVLVVAGAFVWFLGAGIKDMIHHRMHRVGWFLYIWRYCTGMPWHGQHETNARWFTRGHGKALTRTGYARRFYYRPRIVRTGMRLSYPLVPLTIAGGFVLSYQATAGALAAVVLALMAYGGYRAYRAIQALSFRREWLTPAHEAIAPLAEVPRSVRPKDWISLSPDRDHAVFALPEGYNDNDKAKERFALTAAEKLGMEEPDISWRLNGRKPTLTLDASDPPPKEAFLPDIVPALRDSDPDSLVLGIGKKSSFVDVSLHGDSPHVGASMGAGAGKSTLARLIAAQRLAKGDIVLILDIKRISHPWARGLPNVAYCDTPELIHDAFVWLGEELDRRNKLALVSSDYEGNVSANVGPRLIIVAEELNMTANRLRTYWKDVLQGQGVSPALTAMQDVAFAGRQVKMNLAMIGQMLTARVTGGTSGGNEARENIGVRMLARFTKRNWDMLVPEYPMPPVSNVLGRVQVVASGVVRECQVAYITGQQARDLATSGVVSALPSGMPGAPHLTNVTDSNTKELPPTDLHNLIDSDSKTATPVTISEAVNLGLLKLTLKSAKQARFRDPDFPKPVDSSLIPEGKAKNAHYYDPITLADYQAAKDQKKAKG